MIEPIATVASTAPAREAKIYVSLLGVPGIWINGEPVHVRGEATRRVLVHLVLSSPHVIPNHRLIESTWGGSEPESAIDQIRKIISKLRQGLPGGKDLIRTEPGGYRILLGDQQSDLALWRDAIRRSRVLLQTGEECAALAELSDALDLWRGPALDGLEGHPFASESVSLHEERNTALEVWCQLAVKELGAPSVIVRLRREVAQSPLQERLWEVLMTTLASSGRVLEALDEYNNLCKVLSSSLGVRPSQHLQALYRSLEASTGNLTPGPVPPLPRVPRQHRTDRSNIPEWIIELLRGQEPNPAYVVDSCWNVLHRNHAMERWFPALCGPEANTLVWVLTDPSARMTLQDWENHALIYLGMLKVALARRPGDPFLSSVLASFEESCGIASALLEKAIEVESRESHRFTLNLPHISPAPAQVVAHLLTPQSNQDLRIVLLTPAQGCVIL